MATIKLKNPSAVNTVLIDVDPNDRANRYASFKLEPSETKSIDESDINPALATCSAFADGLEGGIIEVIAETDIDSLTMLEVKNFLASGLGQKYYYSSSISSADRIFALDSTAGTAGFMTAIGQEPLGVLQTSSTVGSYNRIATKTGKVVTVNSAGTVTAGDYVGGDVTGRALTVSTSGQYYLGTAVTGGTTGADITVEIGIGSID